MKVGSDLNTIKKALEGRGEIKEVKLNVETGELIINFEGVREWATLKQDAFRQWNVKYYSSKQ